MADTQTELEKHQRTWSNFVKGSFWSAAAIALILILLWIFLL